MKTVLLTGANGQLGNAIKTCCDNYKLHFIFTDINNLDITNTTTLKLFFKKNKIDYIVNCAAYTAVDNAEKEPDKAHLINAISPFNLLHEAEKHGSKLIHISTDYVFDGFTYKPYSENDKPNPQSVYGQTKLQGEINIGHSSQVIIIRTSWLYGTTGNNFVKTIVRLANKNDKLTIVADQIGTPTSADELAKVILKIITFSEHQNSFQAGIYHYSNEGIASWYDFAKVILDIRKINKPIIPIATKDFPTLAQRPFYSVLDKTKIKTTFKLNIPHWQDSLKKLHFLT